MLAFLCISTTKVYQHSTLPHGGRFTEPPGMLQWGQMWCDGRVIQVDNAACLGDNKAPGQTSQGFGALVNWAFLDMGRYGIWSEGKTENARFSLPQASCY